jgi:hypothetical protein
MGHSELAGDTLVRATRRDASRGRLPIGSSEDAGRRAAETMAR